MGKLQVGRKAILWFGKYKGQSIEWVAENDIGYLSWAKDEGIFEIEDVDILQMIDDYESNHDETISSFGPPEGYKWD